MNESYYQLTRCVGKCDRAWLVADPGDTESIHCPGCGHILEEWSVCGECKWQGWTGRGNYTCPGCQCHGNLQWPYAPQTGELIVWDCEEVEWVEEMKPTRCPACDDWLMKTSWVDIDKCSHDSWYCENCILGWAPSMKLDWMPEQAKGCLAVVGKEEEL